MFSFNNFALVICILTMADTFQSFCSFIKQEFFSSESIGEEVSFAVDKYTIHKFCNKDNVSEKELLDSVHKVLWYYRPSISHIIGILAIQLYAASLRENNDGYTENNYRDRLSILLNWYITDLQSWMTQWQDYYWQSLYNWCTDNGFEIFKCSPKIGKNRYVQYPIEHSKSVFTIEDLLYIAKCFVDNNLLPGEDISFKEFKSIIKDYTIRSFTQTNHGKGVIYYSRRAEDYLRQVYNFYLRWDGLFKDRNTQRRIVNRKDSTERQLYMTDDLNTLEFRTKDMVLQEPRLDINKLTYDTIKNEYTFRRKYNSVILFKQDDVYDNYWQETRYLTPGSIGRALIFKERSSLFFIPQDILKQSKSIIIVEIREDNDPFDCYSEEKPFSVVGGLKIGRDTYLLGAGPNISVSKNVPFWINGEKYKGIGEYPITEKGKNIVKFRDYHSIEINIVPHFEHRHIWTDNYTHWHLDKKNAKWEPSKNEGLVMGLDFSSMCTPETQDGVLKRWANFHLLRSKAVEEKNIAIKQLINSDHEY